MLQQTCRCWFICTGISEHTLKFEVEINHIYYFLGPTADCEELMYLQTLISS